MRSRLVMILAIALAACSVAVTGARFESSTPQPRHIERGERSSPWLTTPSRERKPSSCIGIPSLCSKPKGGTTPGSPAKRTLETGVSNRNPPKGPSALVGISYL